MESDGPAHSFNSLRGHFNWREAPQRPPWTVEALIRERCTGCGICIEKCPESLLSPGPAGTPVLDFKKGGCTLCGLCADICPESVFQPNTEKPWDLVAEIAQNCLMNAGISCRTCTDACDDEALLFDMRSGPAGRVYIIEDACTGCGACVSVCPVNAISLSEKPKDTPGGLDD